MAKRYFTVAEANAMVPWLEERLRSAMMIRATLRAVGAQMGRLGEPLSQESLSREGGEPELVAARARARGLVAALGDEVEQFAAAGVELKDLETGLCDFVALREGRDVYLCWRLGEKQVGHWHELAAGFAGRQPLESAEAPLLH